MEKFGVNWWWATILLPVLIGFFKTEIGKMVTAYNVYRLRAFDVDGDPTTSDKAQLLNDATGKWSDIIIEKYVFSLSARKRGVYIRYPDGGKEKVPLVKWAGMRKRKPPLKAI